MTYCLALRVNDGIVFGADTRTNAGVDYVTSYRKLHVFGDFEDRIFVLLTAGNLGVSQEVCHWIHRDLLATDGRESLRSATHLFEAADYVGRVSRAVQERHAVAFTKSGIGGSTSIILGGQIRGSAHNIFLIYPQGNYIRASDDTPYLQIGENKYGKPMLDRLLTQELSLAETARLALVSLDGTIRSNVTVGLPIDLAIYEKDALKVGRHIRLDQHTPYLNGLRDSWQEGLARVFSELPKFDWEHEVGAAVVPSTDEADQAT
ncbi:MAG TPA: peptidase [Pseudomonadales bacterium]|nr:peptidase [Pseudomonadales bacterium]